ncbi:hypothetical protein ABEB36_011535 [Hypothenemus hampei]|uniref:Gustatory receptor n=1 Tax=Hypothenemus hampei TaxID=57062 RepID=A0ABD1E8F3_HYPHA
MFFYLTFLQMLLLLAISSHLSKLLIIFIDLIEQVPKTVSSKYTVMGIISGVPLITIFGNHLAYKSMNLNLKSWWIIRSSLAFNIFLTVVSIITGLFIFIYLLIVNKLKRLMTMRKQHESMTKEKWMIALIRRAACMFLAVLGFIVSSTIYINNQNLLWSIYQFGGVNIIMGLSTVVCYIFNCELGLKYLFTKQPKIDDKNYFSVDLTEPLHFTIQKETEILNQSPGQGLQSQISLRPLDNYKIVTGKTQAISNAFESCLQTSSNFCTDLNSLTDSKSSIRNEKNHTTPMDITKTNISCFNAYNNFSQSPDILTATNLDLVVAHSICTSTKSRAVQNFEVPPLLKNEHKPMTEPKTVRIIFPPQVIVTPDEDSVQIQCERRIKQLSNGEGDDDGKHVETLLNKQENLNTITTTTTTTDETRRVTFKGDKDHLDGVLDRISHDLDYLLNRGEDNIESSSSISIKKHMTNTDSEKILSELLLNDDTPTLDSILLRTNC